MQCGGLFEPLILMLCIFLVSIFAGLLLWIEGVDCWVILYLLIVLPYLFIQSGLF